MKARRITIAAAAALLTAATALAQGAQQSALRLTMTDGTVKEYGASQVRSLHIDKASGTVSLTLTNGGTEEFTKKVKHIGFTGDKGTEVSSQLADYGPLKSYVNRLAYPSFKLGCATNSGEFNRKGSLYQLNCENFDEVVSENDFKYQSIVDNNGQMNFSTVKTFVKTASEAGLDIYGHCLAWHSQQNPTYLRSLLKPTGNTVSEGELFSYSFDDGVMMMGWGNNQQRDIVNGSHNGTKCMSVSNPTAVNVWESQVAADFEPALTQGYTYTLHFWAKASAPATLSAILQQPSQEAGWPTRGDFGQFSVGTEWKEFTLTATVNGDNATRCIFNIGNFAGTLYLDDVSLTGKVAGQMSAEEKRQVLTDAMERWIKGMMEACDGKVKAWDVVNEAISGNNPDSEGVYALQHDDGNQQNFFWQDYMGDLEYARTAVRLARQYGPQDLTLFINDYNLESDWDNNGKLRSFIKWIERWEADGVTRIDGIGSQMHINCYMNPQTQQSKKKAITNMFRLMAATGKMVRVSEIDMGLIDSNGNTVNTNNVTPAQHQEMANLYKFVVDQYLTIVPPAQQWGICHWSIGDSPNNQWAWRHNEPLGLWNEQKTQRKLTFKGFADGLAGYQ